MERTGVEPAQRPSRWSPPCPDRASEAAHPPRDRGRVVTIEAKDPRLLGTRRRHAINPVVGGFLLLRADPRSVDVACVRPPDVRQQAPDFEDGVPLLKQRAGTLRLRGAGHLRVWVAIDVGRGVDACRLRALRALRLGRALLRASGRLRRVPFGRRAVCLPPIDPGVDRFAVDLRTLAALDEAVLVGLLLLVAAEVHLPGMPAGEVGSDERCARHEGWR